MSFRIIGVTGGIGAGKSSVSAILKEAGAEIIDADLISHQAVEPGKPAWYEIIEEFGQDVVRPDKSLDRKKLAGLVFGDDKLKIKLENIIHRQVVAEITEKVNSLKEQGYEGLIVLDVPIPVEHGFLDIADTVWVVSADVETRVKRIVARSGLSDTEAMERIKAQLSQDEYLKLADKVIINNSAMSELRNVVEDLLKEQIN